MQQTLKVLQMGVLMMFKAHMPGDLIICIKVISSTQAMQDRSKWQILL